MIINTFPKFLEYKDKNIYWHKDLYIKEALSTLMIENNTFESDEIQLNLSKNTKSLKKSVFLHLQVKPILSR